MDCHSLYLKIELKDLFNPNLSTFLLFSEKEISFVFQLRNEKANLGIRNNHLTMIHTQI